MILPDPPQKIKSESPNFPRKYPAVPPSDGKNFNFSRFPPPHNATFWADIVKMGGAKRASHLCFSHFSFIFNLFFI
jgi:hypothetical protein